MLLGSKPEYPGDFHGEFGFRPDYKGLGVFLYRSERRGKWYVVSIQNQGLESITLTGNLDQHIKDQNSCEFDLNEKERGGIRVKILMDYIYVYKKDANGDPSYSKCVVNQIRDPYFHFFSMVSYNKKRDDRVSSIDIDAMYWYNYDKNAFNDKALIDAEKLEFSAENKNIKKLDDGTYH